MQLDYYDWYYRNKVYYDFIENLCRRGRTYIFDGCEVSIVSGLTVSCSAGKVLWQGVIYDTVENSVTLPPNVVAFLYLDTNGFLTYTTSVFEEVVVPLALVQTSHREITKVKDVRLLKPVPVPISCEPLTGGIIGGGVRQRVSANTYTMCEYSCMDSTNTTLLYKDTPTTLVVDETLSSGQLYHIFMIKKSDGSFGYGYDTDIDGANLATNFDATHWRWDGLAAVGSNNELVECSQIVDTLICLHPDNSFWHLPDVGTTAQTISFSSLPLDRIRMVTLAFTVEKVGAGPDFTTVIVNCNGDTLHQGKYYDGNCASLVPLPAHLTYSAVTSNNVAHFKLLSVEFKR